MNDTQTAIKGRHYIVISDEFEFFKAGDEVIALEDGDVPYCILVNDFNGGFDLSNYGIHDYSPLRVSDELAEKRDLYV